MSDPRRAFLEWTDCLLDAARTPGEQREAAHAWCDWAMGELGIDRDRIEAAEGPFTSSTGLPTGRAISPQRAALCVREYRRTAVFLQAMAAAIRAARAGFPGETLHVVEAGCGPLAALTMPFMARYAPSEVSFTLLDLHEASLAGVRHLAGWLGVEASIRETWAGDAGARVFAPAERPHVIACEVLCRALKAEPQVAVTRALAPQLRPGGFFLPERIEVDAGLLDGARHLRRSLGQAGPGEPDAVVRLGPAFVLDARAVPELAADAGGRIPAGEVMIPVEEAGRRRLKLFTRLQVFRDHVLNDFDCSLTMPEPLRDAAALAAGGTVRFSYEISTSPGLRLECRPATDPTA